MAEELDIKRDLKPLYFWDVDIERLDVEKSKRLIIERVFVYGTSGEIRKITDHYGTEEVCNVLKNLKYIDPKTLNIVSRFFNISLQDFKCYTHRQSMRQHWIS